MTAVSAVRSAVSRRTLARVNWRVLDRLTLLGCLTIGLIVGLSQAIGAITDPYDAHMYWNVDTANMYPIIWSGGYVYAPPLALIVNALHPIGWPLFIAAFTTATWAAFWYCTRVLAPVVLLASLALVPIIGGNVVGYLFLGNIQLLMAAAIVASVRHSAGWTAVPLLTKGVGIPLVWFVVRREWSSVTAGLAVPLMVIAVTLALAPDTWLAFVRFVIDNHVEASPVPVVPIALPVRLAAAIVLVGWGGLTNRRWTVPIAAGIAIPALYEWSFLAVWIGAIGIEWPSARGE